MKDYISSSCYVRDDIAFCDAYKKLVFSLLKDDERLILGDADLGRAMFGAEYAQLKKEHPKQMFDVGIAEANLVGIASGLSVYGRVPVVHSFSAFITRRTYDTAFVSGAYAGLNLKLVGSDPGITSTYNGGTHTTFEDVGLFRAVPGAVIFEPADNEALRCLFPQIVRQYGISYTRMPRKILPWRIYPENVQLQIGRAQKLREGSDLTIFALGTEVYEALKAADILQNKGISARVMDVVSVSPLDREAVIAASKETGAIVTAENHSIHTGLFAAVCEILAETRPCVAEAVGVRDEFGAVGNYDELLDCYSLTATDIAAAAKKCLDRKC